MMKDHGTCKHPVATQKNGSGREAESSACSFTKACTNRVDDAFGLSAAVTTGQNLGGQGSLALWNVEPIAADGRSFGVAVLLQRLQEQLASDEGLSESLSCRALSFEMLG
eukprot:2385787-Amphidinium_carterae.1